MLDYINAHKEDEEVANLVEEMKKAILETDYVKKGKDNIS